MKTFYKIKNDAMFKAIFCKKENKDILERLISEVINKKVNIIRLDVPEVKKRNIKEKGKTLDVLVKCEEYLINIEINTESGSELNRRNASYIFSKYIDSTHVNENYLNMPFVIQINLSDMKSKELVYKYTLYDKDNNKTYIDNLEIYELNIEKIKKECYNTHRYSIIKLLDCNLEELENIKGDEMMKRVVKEAKYLNEDSEFVKFMDEEQDVKMFHNTLVAMGKREGIEEGKKEQTLEIVRNMLKENVDISFISKVTNLSIEEINKIQ